MIVRIFTNHSNSNLKRIEVIFFDFLIFFLNSRQKTLCCSSNSSIIFSIFCCWYCSTISTSYRDVYGPSRTIMSVHFKIHGWLRIWVIGIWSCNFPMMPHFTWTGMSNLRSAVPRSGTFSRSTCPELFIKFFGIVFEFSNSLQQKFVANFF